jgi:hypothetical protein
MSLPRASKTPRGNFSNLMYLPISLPERDTEFLCLTEHPASTKALQ